MCDEGSAGEDFGGHSPYAAMIQCPLCGWQFRSAERMARHEGDEMCQQVQAERVEGGQR